MNILLVSPAPANATTTRVWRELPYLRADAFFAPHACAVVAALTPREHRVRIHDEHLHGPVDDLFDRERYDVVGISLASHAYQRALEIADRFRASRQRGVIVAGGSALLHMVEGLRGRVDVLFLGEAEETWPRFLREYAEGCHAPVYRQTTKPDLANTPAPRWELIREDLLRYAAVAVQTVRGCPRDCAFCDVTYLYGRRLRHKPIDRILDEVRRLQSYGVEMVFFADDNFAADRKHAKELLRRLIPINNAFSVPLSFATQTDLTVAEDDELLQLLLDANFVDLQIGIEAIEPQSLHALHKPHNLRRDPAAAVRKIQSYGMLVLCHLIVGVDSHGPDVFDRYERFLREANAVLQASHPLMAPPGTRLWHELKRAGRLIEVSPEMHDRLDLDTNVIPEGMSRVELIAGLARYRRRVSEPEHFLGRVRGFLAGLRHRPTARPRMLASLWSRRKTLLRVLRHHGLTAPARERRTFFAMINETMRRRPDLMPTLMYAHICQTMQRRQAEVSAERARQIIEAEREQPDGPPVMSTSTVLADPIRRDFKQIASVAYRHVRARVAHRETLYAAVVEALSDYTRSFGATYDSFDDHQRVAVETSCDRVLAKLARPPAAAGEAEPGRPLPEHKPPPGFAREVIDALDQHLRLGHPASATP